jgi:hypothetical protein
LLTFYDQLNQEIEDVDKAVTLEDSPDEEMPGVIRNNLPIKDTQERMRTISKSKEWMIR